MVSCCVVAVDSEEAGVFEAGKAELKVFGGDAHQRVRQARDHGRLEEGVEAAGVGGAVEQAHEPQHGHFAPAFVAAIARATRERGRQPAWINLEYLSAEGYVERFHGLASPVTGGPAKGLVKRFFYPGFTPATGGLIREQDLDRRRRDFDRAAWRAGQGLPASREERAA